MNGYITRVADEIADILLREGIDYVQSKAVFRAARIKAGLHAPKETRNAPARLTLEEQLRFIDAAYARNGRTGLMVQTLLETGARVSEFVALRVEDVSLGERTIAVESGKGGKRREVPFRAELARLPPCTSATGQRIAPGSSTALQRSALAAALRLAACSAWATTASRVSSSPGSRAARQSGSRLKVVWLSRQYQRAMCVPRGVLRA